MDNILFNIRTVLQITPARWTNLAQTLPAELLKRKPAPSEWSALECLLHLMDTEKHVFPARVKIMLAGQPRFPAFFPDEEGSRLRDDINPADLATEFATLRAESLKVLDSITPADLSRQAPHAELGLVSLSELLHEWAGHDLMHTVQAEQAMMQPFIEGCGPWQVYFQAHVVKPKEG